MLRILTENFNKEGIEAELLSRGIDYTMYEAHGSWKGKTEPSLVIEIDCYGRSIVFDAAEGIRKLNNQQAVFVQEVPSTLYSITEKGKKCLTP